MKSFSRISFIAVAALLACPTLLAQTSADASRLPSPRESLRQAFAEANADFAAGRYDEAISGYDEALMYDSSQYVIWTKKASAYRMRGITSFNKALAAKDEAGKNVSKKDFLAAVESANKALALIDAVPPPSDDTARANLAQARLSALEEKGSSLQVIGERFNEPAAEEDAIAAYKAAIDLARDPQKKNALRNKEAAVFTFKGDNIGLLAISKAVLDSDAVNVEALLNAFLACVGLPDMDVKGAREYGTRYLKAAPANDPRRKDVQDVLEALPKLK
jgi:tetratricopeptide (TPR) repeat protein